MQELIQYIKNNKANPEKIRVEVSDDRSKPLPQRFKLAELKKYTRDFFRQGTHPKMLALSGLRGVGKTTLMWQTARYVYNNIHKHIYFLGADQLALMGFSLFEAIQALEKHVLKKPLNQLGHQLMLLIDEVHDAKNWDKTLKYLYDRSKNVFILVTGSLALLLHKSPDLASRCSFIKIFPFSFTEFTLAKSWMTEGKENALQPPRELSHAFRQMLFFTSDYSQLKEKITTREEQITTYFKKVQVLFQGAFVKSKFRLASLREEYISYYNIARFLPVNNKGMIINRVISLFDRIITKDIPGLKPEEAELIYRMLFRLAASDQLSFQTLAKDFRIKEAKVESLIQMLTQAEVLNLFHPHGGIRSKTGLNRKAFFMSPSLRRALYERIYGHVTTPELRAKLHEDIVAMYLRRTLHSALISYGASKEKNPDFIIETRDQPILLELGINKTGLRQITHAGIHPYRYGLILNSKAERPVFYDRHRIISLPLDWFLLM